MEQKYVYVVFSATPYKIGKMIRTLTHEPYNHVSIALDEELDRMYAFARRYCRVPLYGGFVKETTSRYAPGGHPSTVKIHKLPVSQEAYEALAKRLEEMYENREEYLYNHLSFLAVPLKKPIAVRDAYTCLEFCVEVLHDLGFPVNPGTYYSLGDLREQLASYAVYEGEIHVDGTYDEEFFAKKPLPHPTHQSAKSILELVPRLKQL